MKKIIVMMILATMVTMVLSESELNLLDMMSRIRRSPKRQLTSSRRPSKALREEEQGLEERLVGAAQTRHRTSSRRQKAEPRLGYSGTVVDGRSAYILKYNEGVPIYGAGEPYYFSYTHNFPIATADFQSLVNSHNLPHKYKFSGGLDVTGLLH